MANNNPQLGASILSTLGSSTGSTFPSQSSIPAIALRTNPNLLAMYDDEEGGGGAFMVDVSGNGNSGLYRGNAALVNDVDLGPAVSLDGVGDYLQAVSATPPPGDAMSFSCWVKLNAIATQAVCSWGLPSGSNFHDIMRPFSDGKVYVVTDDGASGFVGSSNSYTTGVPIFLCGVWDGSTHTVYVNDTKTTANNKTSPIATLGDLFIGCRGNQGPGAPDSFVNGLIAKMRWFNYGVTDQDASDLRNNGVIV